MAERGQRTVSRRLFLRRVAAAQAILDAAGFRGNPVRLYDRWTPPENEPLKRADEERWKLGLPHVLDTPWPTL